MLDVKCCSDRIQQPQNLSSALRSLYNKIASGAINPEGDLPLLLTQESNGKPALCTREHQSRPAEAPSGRGSTSTGHPPLASAQKRDQYQTAKFERLISLTLLEVQQSFSDRPPQKQSP